MNGSSSAQLSIAGGTGCWVNDGTFNSDTSTVIFTNAAATMAGETNFYTITIDSGAELTMSTDNIMRIAGTITNNGVWRARSPVNTVEYSGGNQTVLNPNGGTGGYRHLILSGAGTKTMPASALTIAGNFSLSGNTSATAESALTVSGNFTIGSGTTYDASGFSHSVGGDFTNNGAFTASTSAITLNGTPAQTISGTTTSAFNNLTISNTSAVVSANTNFSVDGTLGVDSNAVLSPDASAVISGSGTLTGSGTVQVTRTETTADFISQYTISNKTLADLTVEYAGTATQEVSAITYGNLKVNNSGGVTLAGAATVNGTLTVASGILTTGSSNTLTLGSSGMLSEADDADGNSTNDSVVVGNIQTTRTLTTGVNETFGGLGVQVNAAGSAPGSTVVLRKTGTGTAQIIDGIAGIMRTFDITPTTNTGLNATFVSKYADSELDGINEANLVYAKSTDGGTTWPNRYTPTRDTDANMLTLTGVNELSKWTAGPFAIKYIVSSSGGSLVAGSSVTITAQLADAGNNSISAAGKVVTWSSAGGGSLASPTSITDASGIATVVFTTSATAGTVHTVTGTDADNVTGTSSDITTIAGSASKVVFVQQPSDATAGATISPSVTVQLQDTHGNNISTSGISIEMALSSGTGTLNGTTLKSTDAGGLATFNDLSIDLAGSKNLTASSGGLTSAVSNAFAISAGTAAKVVFVQQPSDTTAGDTISPSVTVQLQDINDNNVSNSGVPITMALSSGTGVLSGTSPQTTDAGGLATFSDLSINLTGAKNLTASSAGLTSAVSNTFTIITGTATKVRVETAADGSGTVVPLQSIAAGSSIIVYAIARDDSDNFEANVAADAWSLQNITNGVVSGDLVPGGDAKSAVFTGHFSGTTEIMARFGSLATTNSGTLTVTAGVSLTSPANNATDVATNRSITATFTEAMEDSTITTATFTVSDGGGNIIGAVSYSGTTATFTPSSSLSPATTYTVTITADMEDLAGNATASDYIWSFTTGTSADTTAPTVSSINPANGATGVAINTAITAAFSETMSVSAISTATFTISNGSSNISGAVSYIGTTATFTPLSNLSPSTTYTATITTEAKDLAGSAMASYYTWSFTTGTTTDTAPPTVSSTNPTNGATGVAINTAITATFGETMSISTMTTATFALSDSSGIISGAVSYSGTTATFIPLSNLAYSTPYTATITTGARDLAGNAMASNSTWSFTTVSPTEPPPPPKVTLTINSTSPSNGATGVAVNSFVSATFSMLMNGSTLNTDTFMLSDGDGEVGGTVTTNGSTATFIPLSNLAYNTIYTATITTGAQAANFAGTTLDSGYTWSFVTELAPITPTPTHTETPTPTQMPTPTPMPTVTPTPANSLYLSKETAYLEGDMIVATVVDADRNTSLISADILTTALNVIGSNIINSAGLLLDLNENGINSGTFLATIKTGTVTTGGASVSRRANVSSPYFHRETEMATSSGVSSSIRSNIGTIKAVQGGIATVIYTDTTPYAFSLMKTLTFSSFNATLSFDAGTYFVESYTGITLADAERNTNHTTAETLLNDVSIETSSSNNTKVRMVETGADTGTFMGSIQIVTRGGTLEFERIQASEGDTLKITYADEVNTTGFLRIVMDTAMVATTVTPTPLTTPTAIPTVTSTPVVCSAELITVFPGKLELEKEESDVVTVTLTGEDDCRVEGAPVKVKITQGRGRISVSPAHAITDAEGLSQFAVTALKKIGKAKVKFISGKAKSVVKVKVVK